MTDDHPASDAPAYVVVPEAVRARAAALLERTLFVEDPDHGPAFRYATRRIYRDNDMLLGAIADVIVNDLVANPDVLRDLLQAAVAQQAPPTEWAELPLGEYTTRAVVDPLCPSGGLILESTDRRVLLHLELLLGGRGPGDLRAVGQHLGRYLRATCAHHFHGYPAEDGLPAHRQCMWCNHPEFGRADGDHG